MYIKYPSYLLLVSALFLSNISVLSAVEITQGMMLANTCSACHGTDGKSPGAIPSINGKSVEFLIKALSGFRDGSRVSTVMGRHAKGYSDDEIKRIAEYFSKLP